MNENVGRRVPVVVSSGIGGTGSSAVLYEAELDGILYVIWELADGRIGYAPAFCPHRPRGGPVLVRLGMVDGTALVCTRHGNRYDKVTGTCSAVHGSGEPGRLRIRFGWRDGADFVLAEDGSETASKQIAIFGSLR